MPWIPGQAVDETALDIYESDAGTTTSVTVVTTNPSAVRLALRSMVGRTDGMSIDVSGPITVYYGPGTRLIETRNLVLTAITDAKKLAGEYGELSPTSCDQDGVRLPAHVADLTRR